MKKIIVKNSFIFLYKINFKHKKYSHVIYSVVFRKHYSAERAETKLLFYFHELYRMFFYITFPCIHFIFMIEYTFLRK